MMKRRFALLIAVFLVVAFSLQTRPLKVAYADDTNLVVNPSFESNGGNNTAPNNWNITESPSVVTNATTLQPHSGTYSLTVTMPWWLTTSRTVSDQFAVTPSTAYIVGVFQLGPFNFTLPLGEGNSIISVRVEWFNSSHVSISNTTAYYSSLYGVNDVWKNDSGSVSSPSNAAYASVYLWVYDNDLAGFQMYLDDAFMYPVYAGPLFVQPNISVVGDGEISVAPTYPYYQGETLIITAYPKAGSYFAYFTRNGIQVSPTANPQTFTNLQSGETFVAVFQVTSAAPNPNAVNLQNFPTQLAIALGVSGLPYAGGLMASSLLLMFFLLPTLFICSKWDKDMMIPGLIVGESSLALCVAFTWMPAWIFIVQALMIAAMMAGVFRDWLSGRGGGA